MGTSVELDRAVVRAERAEWSLKQMYDLLDDAAAKRIAELATERDALKAQLAAMRDEG